MDSELVLLLFKTMARLPSLEILSCACFSSGPVMGFSLAISNPSCSKNLDLVEPYAKIPARQCVGGGVNGLTDACSWLWLEEAERELAVPRDELLPDGEHLPRREGIIRRGGA